MILRTYTLRMNDSQNLYAQDEWFSDDSQVILDAYTLHEPIL